MFFRRSLFISRSSFVPFFRGRLGNSNDFVLSARFYASGVWTRRRHITKERKSENLTQQQVQTATDTVRKLDGLAERLEATFQGTPPIVFSAMSPYPLELMRLAVLKGKALQLNNKNICPRKIRMLLAKNPHKSEVSTMPQAETSSKEQPLPV